MNFGGGRRKRDVQVVVVEATGHKSLIWKLPHIKLEAIGKIGPAFGLGAGCGVGFGLGIVGGLGIGPGVPGFQVGFGLGAGCGAGLGFGYGIGRGVACDEHRMHSNVGKLFGLQHLPSEDKINVAIDEFVINTKKLVRTTLKEVDKWRR